MEEQKPSWKKIGLVAAFTAAVTTFVVGIPMAFGHEAITFPFFHETAFGQAIVDFTGSILTPLYNSVGLLFGIEPFGQPLPDVPILE